MKTADINFSTLSKTERDKYKLLSNIIVDDASNAHLYMKITECKNAPAPPSPQQSTPARTQLNPEQFEFFTSQTPPWSWENAESTAIAKGGRLPTLSEMRHYFSSTNEDPLYDKEVWAFCYSDKVRSDGYQDRDAVQLGTSNDVGTSLVEFVGMDYFSESSWFAGPHSGSEKGQNVYITVFNAPPLPGKVTNIN